MFIVTQLLVCFLKLLLKQMPNRVDKWYKEWMNDFLFLTYKQLQYYFCLIWILIGNMSNITNSTNPHSGFMREAEVQPWRGER